MFLKYLIFQLWKVQTQHLIDLRTVIILLLCIPSDSLKVVPDSLNSMFRPERAHSKGPPRPPDHQMGDKSQVHHLLPTTFHPPHPTPVSLSSILFLEHLWKRLWWISSNFILNHLQILASRFPLNLLQV